MQAGATTCTNGTLCDGHSLNKCRPKAFSGRFLNSCGGYLYNHQCRWLVSPSAKAQTLVPNSNEYEHPSRRSASAKLCCIIARLVSPGLGPLFGTALPAPSLDCRCVRRVGPGLVICCCRCFGHWEFGLRLVRMCAGLLSRPGRTRKALSQSVPRDAGGWSTSLATPKRSCRVLPHPSFHTRRFAPAKRREMSNTLACLSDDALVNGSPEDTPTSGESDVAMQEAHDEGSDATVLNVTMSLRGFAMTTEMMRGSRSDVVGSEDTFMLSQPSP